MPLSGQRKNVNAAASISHRIASLTPDKMGFDKEYLAKLLPLVRRRIQHRQLPRRCTQPF
jgi:hypothetical protein